MAESLVGRAGSMGLLELKRISFAILTNQYIPNITNEKGTTKQAMLLHIVLQRIPIRIGMCKVLRISIALGNSRRTVFYV